MVWSLEILSQVLSFFFFWSQVLLPYLSSWLNNPGYYDHGWEKAMATHLSTLAWKIPQTEEPGRLQAMGSLRVGYDWATSLYFSLSCIGEENGNPLQCSCLENPRDGGAWWAAVYGVVQSRTWLKWLSSSSSSMTMDYMTIALHI